MATKTKPGKTFSLSFRILEVLVSIEITADSFEDALAKSKGFKVSDLISPTEEQYFDDFGELELTSVYKPL